MNPVASGISPVRPSRLFDRAGALWAFLCALHCLALPLIFIAAPTLTASLYSFHSTHRAMAMAVLRLISLEPWFIAISAVITTTAISHGVYWHRRRAPALIAVAGLSSLVMAWEWRLAFGGWAHVLGIGVGGSLLVIAHLWNLRLLSPRHRHD